MRLRTKPCRYSFGQAPASPKRFAGARRSKKTRHDRLSRRIVYIGLLKFARILRIQLFQSIKCAVCKIHSIHSIDSNSYIPSWPRDFSNPMYVSFERIERFVRRYRPALPMSSHVGTT